MNHACIQDAGVMRLTSAGCLTCESDNAPAWAIPTAVIPGRAERREPGIQRRVRCVRPDSGFAGFASAPE